MNPSLQMLEPAWLAVCVQGDDLTVEQDGAIELQSPRVKGLDDFRELGSLLVSQPGPEADTRRRSRYHRGQGADAVVLRLVDERGGVERRPCRRRQHRADTCGVVDPLTHLIRNAKCKMQNANAACVNRYLHFAF